MAIASFSSRISTCLSGRFPRAFTSSRYSSNSNVSPMPASASRVLRSSLLRA